MTFDEALPRVLELLERQGWASARTLRRRFQLDAATLEALKDELMTARQVAVEAPDGRWCWQDELRPAPTSAWEPVASAAGHRRAPASVPPPLAAPGPPWSHVGDGVHRAPPFIVGREHEVALLHARWEQVLASQGQVVCLSGEAGVGKSHLVRLVKELRMVTPHFRWECRCDPYYQHSALYPFIELWQRALQFQPEAPPDLKLHQLEAALLPYGVSLPAMVPLLAALLSIPLGHRYAPLELPADEQKRQTLAAIRGLVQTLAERQPMVLIMEDLHWVDPSTLELLQGLVAHAPTMRLYLIVTARPEFRVPWPRLDHLTVLTLNRLLPAQVEALVQQIAGNKPLPAAVMQQIVTQTEGVPLFVEEVTKMLLASGRLRAQTDRYELTGPLPRLAVPPTLHDSLMARLDALGVAKLVAQVASAWGRAVTEEQLRAVAQLDPRQLARALARLVAADMVREVHLPPRVTYVFRHALIQEAAYASMSDAMRRQTHGEIAQALVQRFPATVAPHPEVVAQHYTAAGLTSQAILYWHQAATTALQRSAYQEALAHLTAALELLHTLPDTPERAQQELALQIALGAALTATKGYAASEVEQAYARARALCQQVGETPQLFVVLRGLARFYMNLGALPLACDLGEQLDRLAQRIGTPTHRLEAHDALGYTLFVLGDYAASWMHLEQGIALTDPAEQRELAFSHGTAPGVTCLAVAASTLWCLGYPAQALRRSQESLALASALAHPHSLAFAHYWAALLHHLTREPWGVQTQAEALLTLATAQEFPLRVRQAIVLQGLALATQGQCQVGIAQMQQGMAAVMTTGQELTRALYLLLLAEAMGHAGQIDEGVRLLIQALAACKASGRGHGLAEAHRLQGALLLRQVVPDAAQAEACFNQALTIAGRQQAKSWELRAAMSLARLWQQQGRRAAARELLAPIYGWFTEGFDTADLQEARALVQELT